MATASRRSSGRFRAPYQGRDYLDEGRSQEGLSTAPSTPHAPSVFKIADSRSTSEYADTPTGSTRARSSRTLDPIMQAEAPTEAESALRAELAKVTAEGAEHEAQLFVLRHSASAVAHKAALSRVRSRYWRKLRLYRKHVSLSTTETTSVALAVVPKTSKSPSLIKYVASVLQKNVLSSPVKCIAVASALPVCAAPVPSAVVCALAAVTGGRQISALLRAMVRRRLREFLEEEGGRYAEQ